MRIARLLIGAEVGGAGEYRKRDIASFPVSGARPGMRRLACPDFLWLGQLGMPVAVQAKGTVKSKKQVEKRLF